jgi:hypothetical protein
MSQIGTIISCGGTPQEYGTLNWVVDFSYQLDAGGIGQSRVVVGNNSSVSGTAVPPATSTLWTSPTSTVTVSPNPPGTTNPVLLPCPPIVQAAAFGLPWK